MPLQYLMQKPFALTFCIVDCVDVGQYCHDWAAKGECTNNPGYMLVSCKKSCNNCGSTGILKIAFNEGRHTYIIVTDMEGNIRIYILPKGCSTDQWKWYCSSQRQGQYHFHWSVPRPKGSLSILILHSISVTIVFIALKTRIWHIQYKCIEIVNQDHWRFP